MEGRERRGDQERRIRSTRLSADEKKKKFFLAVDETRRSSWLAPRAGFSLEKLGGRGETTGRTWG